MRKNLLLLWCLVISMQLLYAQTPTNEWSSHISGPTDNHVIAVKHDAEGNQYVLGAFTETVLVDGKPVYAPTAAYDAFFLAKYTPDGEVIWATPVSNTAENYGEFKVNDMHVSPDGAITLAGNYSKTLTLKGASALTTSNKLNIFYARYNAQGQLDWARSLGSDAGEETANSLTLDKAGNIYLTGHLFGDVHIDKPEHKRAYTAYAAKLNANGTVEWLSESKIPDVYLEDWDLYGIDPDDPEAKRAFGKKIALDPMGNVIVAGDFNYVAAWGNQEVSTFPRTFGYDVFVIKLNQAGSPLWAEMAGGSYELASSFNTLDVDMHGNIYLAGAYEASIRYGDLYLSTRHSDFLSDNQEEIYILKIAPDGKELWLTGTSNATTNDVYERDYNNTVQSLVISPESKVYVTGFMSGNTTMFGDIKVTPSSGMRDRYIAEISASGKWLWVEKFNVNLERKTNGALSLDKEGNLYLAAEFNKVTLHDITLEATMSEVDIFFSKWKVGEDMPVASKVTGFTLVNAATDKDLMELNDGDVLYLDNLPAELNIRANTAPVQVGSVVLQLNDWAKRTENVAPYALAGDRNGNYHAMPALTPGHYTLTATPYSEMNRRGKMGEPLTIHFEVKEKQDMIRFVLVDARTNQDVMEIKQGDVLALDRLPSRINVRAEVMQQGVNSVVLQLNNWAPRLENEAPYALAGDRNGDYHAMNPGFSAGQYSLTAKAYAGKRARGAMQAERTIRFEVLNNNATRLANTRGSVAQVTEAFSTEVRAYPNPFSGKISFDVAVAESGRVALEVFDLQGKSVKHLFEGTMEAGSSQTFEFDGAQLKNGVYITKIIIGDQVKHQRIILRR